MVDMCVPNTWQEVKEDFSCSGILLGHVGCSRWGRNSYGSTFVLSEREHSGVKKYDKGVKTEPYRTYGRVFTGPSTVDVTLGDEVCANLEKQDGAAWVLRGEAKEQVNVEDWEDVEKNSCSEANAISCSEPLALRKVPELEVVKPVFPYVPFDVSNLVDIRVNQTVFLVKQPFVRDDSLIASDSAIENCNRIFWRKNGKNEASNVWNVSKEAGYFHPGQEDMVISSLQALTFRVDSKARKSREEIRTFVDENN